MSHCTLCKKQASYRLKGSSKWYCEKCAEETFGELNLNLLEKKEDITK